MRRTCGYGFEGGDLYGFTTSGTAPTVQNSHVLTGNYSGDVNVASAGNGYVQVPQNPNTTSLVEFVHILIEFAAIPTVRRAWLRFNNASAGSTNVEVAVESNGKISLGLNGATVDTGSVVLSAGQRYEIEIAVDRLGGYWATRINGVTDIDWTANASISGSASTNLFLGCFGTGASALHYYFDDLICDGEEWVGHGKVKRLSPASINTDHANWTLAAGASKTAAISDTTADDDTTYIVSPSNTTDAILFDLTALPSDVVGIRAIWARTRVKRDGGTNGGVIPSLVYLGFVSPLNTITSTSAYVTNLDTGASGTCGPTHPCWDKNIAAALKLQLKSNSANQSRVTQCYVEISYSDTAGSDADVARREIIATFATGDDSEFTWNNTINQRSGTWAIAAWPPDTALNALRVNPANAAQGYNGILLYNDYWPSANRQSLFIGFDFYAASLPSSSFTAIWSLCNGTMTNQAQVRLYSDGSLALNSVTEGEFGTKTPAGTIVTGQKYDIQIHCRVASSGSATDGEFDLYVDGARLLHWTGIRPGNTIASSFSVVYGARGAVSGGCDFYFHDIVSDWCSLPPRDLLLAYLVPTGAGSQAGSWTAQGDSDVYKCIDDPVPGLSDGDTTYALAPASNNNVTTFTLTDLPGTAQTVLQVMLYQFTRRDAVSGVAGNAIELRTVNGTLRGTRIGGVATAGVYLATVAMIPVARGRGRWTVPLINATELALITVSSSFLSRVTRAFVVVEYLTRIPTNAASKGAAGMQG